MTKRPSASLVNVRTSPVASWVAVTVAPGMTALGGIKHGAIDLGAACLGGGGKGSSGNERRDRNDCNESAH